MCVFSSHSFWTSSSLDVPAGVTQEEGHTRFLIHHLPAKRALIFLARRIQPFLSVVGREVEFCELTIESFSTLWALLFLFFCFLVRKIPFAGIELTSQRVRGLRGTSELPGRPVLWFISHFQLARYESSCGHRIEDVTPKQTGNEHGRKKQNKTQQLG